ncbi:MAG TPA: hypothetical protein VFH70_02155 [Acidimicrobiales bacterium]|nr:hypothetical protein [Acidimicrobiales bacterium]
MLAVVLWAPWQGPRTPTDVTAGTPPSTSMVTAAPTEVYRPPGFGVSVRIPPGWTDTGPVNGFEAGRSQPSAPRAFVLFSRLRPGPDASPTQLAGMRISFLAELEAAVDSFTTRTLQGHPAVVLRYRLPDKRGGSVDDTEYDLFVGGTVTVVVIGEPSPPADAALVRQIEASLRVTAP